MIGALVGAVLALAIAVPTQARASIRGYAGTIDPSGTLSFKLKKKHGKSRVRGFRFEQVPITCNEGPDTTFGHLEYSVKVKRRKFHVSAVHRPGDFEGSTLKVDGKLKDGRRRAEGTLRVFGSPPLSSGNTGTSCHTGKRPWTAERF